MTSQRPVGGDTVFAAATFGLTGVGFETVFATATFGLTRVGLFADRENESKKRVNEYGYRELLEPAMAKNVLLTA